MKNRIIVSLVLAFGSIMSVEAQQSPISNFYNFNEYLLNPAEAGYRNQVEGSLSHRRQWQGINGAPITTFLGVHGGINDNMGLGGKVFLDQTDVLKQFSAALSYAYRININEDMKLNFGVSGMMLQNSINYGDAVIADESDEVLTGGSQQGMTFDAEAGIMLEYKKGKLGIATSNLFESGINYDLKNGTGTFSRIRQFSAYGSYLIEVGENWDVEPFVMVRNQGPSSFQYEVNALTSWKQTLFLGAGYRQEAGFIGRLGFQITDQIIAAYAYEFSNTGIASRSSGSHEIMIGYKLNRLNKSAITPKVEDKMPLEDLRVNEEKTEQKKVETTEPEILEENSPNEVVVQEEVLNETTVEAEEEIEKAIPVAKEEVLKQAQVTDVGEETPIKATTETPIERTSNEELSPKEKEVLDAKIVFKFEESALNEETRNKLDKMVQVLKDHPTSNVIIEGHTCNMGSVETNTRYSLARANKVKEYFLQNAVNPSQLKVKAMRDTQPLLPNTSLENRVKNRRVELKIVD